LEIMRYGDGKDFDPALLALFFRDLPLIRGISARPAYLIDSTDHNL